LHLQLLPLPATGTKQQKDWLEIMMEKLEEHHHLSAA